MQVSTRCGWATHVLAGLCRRLLLLLEECLQSEMRQWDKQERSSWDREGDGTLHCIHNGLHQVN